MIPFAWLAAGALALARAAAPKALERQHAAKFARNADGVIVGAEPIDMPRPDGPAVLLLHGGGDTPQSMAELATHLHARGFAVRAPLLPSHGRSIERFTESDAGDWREQTRGEFQALCAKHAWVGVVGQSVGGALAVDLAATNAAVKAMVLLAPWIAMPDRLRTLAETSRAWEWLVPYLPSLGDESIQDPLARARALTHGIVTPAQLRALAEIASVADAALPNVRAATLTSSRGRNFGWIRRRAERNSSIRIPQRAMYRWYKFLDNSDPSANLIRCWG